MLFLYFVFIAHFTKFTRGSSLFMENLCSWKNQKRKKVLRKKKEKKPDPKKKERVPLCQVKKNIPLWKRLVLVELHAGFQISNKEVVVKPKFAVHDVETRFPFLYASTRLDTKTSIIASNRSFKAVRRFVVLLLSSFWDFPFLPRVFPLPLATLLVIVTSSSTLHWAIEIKKKKCLKWVTFPGKSWSVVIDARRSYRPIGLRFQEAR